MWGYYQSMSLLDSISSRQCSTSMPICGAAEPAFSGRREKLLKDPIHPKCPRRTCPNQRSTSHGTRTRMFTLTMRIWAILGDFCFFGPNLRFFTSVGAKTQAVSGLVQERYLPKTCMESETWTHQMSSFLLRSTCFQVLCLISGSKSYL